MKKRLTGLILLIYLSFTLISSLVAAQANEGISQLKAVYHTNGHVIVSGNTSAKAVVLQIWDAKNMLVAFEGSETPDGSFQVTLRTGLLEAGDYKVKAASTEGGAYVETFFKISTGTVVTPTPSPSTETHPGEGSLPPVSPTPSPTSSTDPDRGTPPPVSPTPSPSSGIHTSPPPSGGTVIAPTAKAELDSHTSRISIAAKANAKGEAEIKVSNEQLQMLLNGLKQLSTSSKVASLKLEVADKLEQAQLTLPKDGVKKLLEQGANTLQIDYGLGVINLDKRVLQQLQMESEEITLAFGKAGQQLSAPAQEMIGARPLVSITISTPKGTISEFGKGKITVSLPYRAPAGENRQALLIYYVDQGGKLYPIHTSLYEPSTQSMLFSTNHLSVYAVGYQPVGFTDTTAHWAKESITYLAARSVVNGMGDGVFSPDNSVTRAEFVKLLAGLSQVDVSGYNGSEFADVKQGDWYAPYVAWAKESQIVQGVSSTQFAPNAPITREQMSTMLMKYIQSTSIELKASVPAQAFADEQKISSWAQQAVKVLQQAGIINGLPNNRFEPQGGATRAEAAKIVASLLPMMIH